MDRLQATSDGKLYRADSSATHAIICAIGRSGMIAAKDKREGDGASPIGIWPLRRLHYRADRSDAPRSRLPMRQIRPEDGWCDDPADPAYNRLITRPYAASHEKLWRDDHVYDLIIELGHNHSPPMPHLGSAIFLHLAWPDYRPTEGCIALAKTDFLDLLGEIGPETTLEITGQAGRQKIPTPHECGSRQT